MRNKIVGLFAANTFSFALVGLSFVVYSRVLSPGEFGAYGAAYAAATMLSLVLDGGIKTTIIKMHRDVTDEEEAVVLWTMLFGALLITAMFYGLQRPLFRWWPQIKYDYRFVLSFLGVSLAFYPLVTLPTAWLEHRLSYGHIAWIESTGMLLERGTPALILLWFHAGVYSFLWALIISRIFRVIALSSFHRCALKIASLRQFRQGVPLLGEGGWIQLGTFSNVARDNLHVLLVGPFFGMTWIGNYTWALQVCQISSQVFAQISARVALPMFARGGSFEERWTQCLFQIRLLLVLTGPVLCGVWLLLPALNAHLFHGRWTAALALIPFLFLRMLPGLATTPLGPLIMVHCGGYIYARTAVLWTLAETLGAALCIALVGPTGLAWSYAVIVWLGLWLMISALGPSIPSLGRQLAQQLVKRPSLYFAGTAVAFLGLLSKNIGPVYATNVWFFGVLAAVVVSVAYLLEPDIRAFMKYGKS